MFTKSRRGEKKKRKVNYNSQFSSILKPTAGLADHRTLVPAEKIGTICQIFEVELRLPERKNGLQRWLLSSCCRPLDFCSSSNKTKHSEQHKPRATLRSTNRASDKDTRSSLWTRLGNQDSVSLRWLLQWLLTSSICLEQNQKVSSERCNWNMWPVEK